MYAGSLLSFVLGSENVIFQLSGFYRNDQYRAEAYLKYLLLEKTSVPELLLYH